MPGAFQGTCCPEDNSTAAAAALITAVPINSETESTERRAARRAEFADWVAQRGKVAATVPMWISRRQWIATVLAWAATEEGAAALRAVHVSRKLFAAVVTAVAGHAEGRTGRNVAVKNDRIAAEAGTSRRSVTTIRRRILEPAGWAMEAVRGAGQRYGKYNRPSIWHLLSRPVFHLSSPSSDQHVTAVGNNSPNTARRRGMPSPSTHKRRRAHSAPAAPRDLHTQKLAAYLARHCKGLDVGHPGRLADVLKRSGLDLSAWTGPALVAALNASMVKRNNDWPDQIANPAGFLAYRIAQLPARPDVEATPIPPGYKGPEPVKRASSAVRAAAKAAAFEAWKAWKAAA